MWSSEGDRPGKRPPHAPSSSSCMLCFPLRQCFRDLGQNQNARKMCEAACSMTATSKEVTCLPQLSSDLHQILISSNQLIRINLKRFHAESRGTKGAFLTLSGAWTDDTGVLRN